MIFLGAPSEEFLSQEITSSDHAFLRAAVPTIQANRRANKGSSKFFISFCTASKWWVRQ